MDEKYVVLKKTEWDELLKTQGALAITPVEGAVVIRTRDIFAGPVLHTYAGAVQTAIEVIQGTGSDATAWLAHLMVVRDYFHERAQEADEVEQKKFPSAP